MTRERFALVHKAPKRHESAGKVIFFLKKTWRRDRARMGVMEILLDDTGTSCRAWRYGAKKGPPDGGPNKGLG